MATVDAPRMTVEEFLGLPDAEPHLPGFRAAVATIFDD